MPGWLVFLIVWAVLSVPAGLFVGAFIRCGKRGRDDT